MSKKNRIIKLSKVKKLSIADPFKKIIDGKEYTVITVVIPILDQQGNVVGITGSNINTELLNNAKYSNGGFSDFVNQIICGHQTIIINNKNPEHIGKKYIDSSESTNTQKILDSANDASHLNFLDTNTDGKKYYKSYIPFYISGSDVVWLSGTSVSKAEFDGNIVKLLTIVVILLIIALIFLTTLFFFMINKSLQPIRQLDIAAKELSKGNLHVAIDFHSDDELGSLAESLRNSTGILSNYVDSIDIAMEEMSKGNFDITLSQNFVGDFEHIQISIVKFITDISKTLSRMNIAASQVSTESEQVANGTEEFSRGASEQAISIEDLALTINKIYKQISDNASNAKDASEKVDSVGSKIIESNSQMQEMIQAITEISSKSSEISKIIRTIEDIAFQTNILALNASVEAARAGSAGSGFAVVAEEVRNLANKSATSAKSTATLIEGTIKAVENGTKIADTTAKSLTTVVTGANEISKIVDKISVASGEQAIFVNQVTTNVDKISYVVKISSSTAEKSAAASEQLNNQAQLLKTLIGKFKLKS